MTTDTTSGAFKRLTLAEVEDVEELAGVAVSGLFANPDQIPAKALSAIAYIVRRRTDPDITYDAIRAMEYPDVLAIFVDAMGTTEAPAPKATLAPPAPPATPPNNDATSSSDSPTSTAGPLLPFAP